MLQPHPATVRAAVDHYYQLASQAAGQDTSAALPRQLQDAVYTLCVLTGTRDIASALAASRRFCGGGGESEASVARTDRISVLPPSPAGDRAGRG
ncbi:DUF5133 domain-containing protein [Streptomyces sp. NPDC006733]|uniref:DUF5133 domain-containing protein n=1 Tax=Streptomyces sp. NPDC006733 TaxID=3155460 RepID=UPI0033D210E8